MHLILISFCFRIYNMLNVELWDIPKNLSSTRLFFAKLCDASLTVPIHYNSAHVRQRIPKILRFFLSVGIIKLWDWHVWRNFTCFIDNLNIEVHVCISLV